MPKPRKPIMSPTRIGAYLECAMKYRYLYVDKIGRFYVRARPEYSFGSTLHQVLQHFHREGGVPSADDLVRHYEDRWIGAGYETPDQEQAYQEAGRGMVEAYHRAAAGRLAQGVETILTEKGIRTDMGPFILSGRVDRVDRHADGTLEVVDYKSGRMEVTPEDVAGSLAMNIYQLILRRNHPGTRVIATIYCLRSGVQASSGMTNEEAERFGQDILILGEEIISRDFEAVEPVRIEACDSCEFLPRCQSFWRMRRRTEDG